MKNSGKTMFRAPSRLRFLFHSFGLGCISSSIFLQAHVFWDILQIGTFIGKETNQTILQIEIIVSLYALIYFIYIFQKIIRQT